jgi:serine/threonine-protein phosphatase 2A regulatory subunit B'
MVYNAMKLFMEINPQLFDDCSQEYTEQQNTAPAREKQRERKWAAIQELANKQKANGSAAPQDEQTEETDGTEDNQKRLDSLNLQDGDRRDRRPGTHERQSSAGSSRSGR